MLSGKGDAPCHEALKLLAEMSLKSREITCALADRSTWASDAR